MVFFSRKGAKKIILYFWFLRIMIMTENEISKIIVDVAYRIHTRLGPGLLESVYEEIMYFELRKV